MSTSRRGSQDSKPDADVGGNMHLDQDLAWKREREGGREFGLERERK